MLTIAKPLKSSTCTASYKPPQHLIACPQAQPNKGRRTVCLRFLAQLPHEFAQFANLAAQQVDLLVELGELPVQVLHR